MGMFDSVTCKYPLPWPEANKPDVSWQTKSINCDLDHFHIDDTGALFVVGEYGREHCIDINGEVEMHTSIDGYWYSVRLWIRHGFVMDIVETKYEL